MGARFPAGAAALVVFFGAVLFVAGLSGAAAARFCAQRRRTARFHRPRRASCCRHELRSIPLAFRMLHMFAANVRTTSWMLRPYATEIQQLR